MGGIKSRSEVTNSGKMIESTVTEQNNTKLQNHSFVLVGTSSKDVKQ